MFMLTFTVMKLSHKAWSLFKYNKDYEYQKMNCLFNDDGNLIAIGYLRSGIADDHDVMEIVMQINENVAESISEIRKALYSSLIDVCKAAHNPARKIKLVTWEVFDGDREFYIEQDYEYEGGYSRKDYIYYVPLRGGLPQLQPFSFN
ncbi:hypothetical protein [Paenibacillus sp. KN14-4R]|uniref:hypothetical protein n=1 Tax=Paenibacillus sp. KN14-4R TaxID=3445773 RepID=UPI003FA07013